MSEIIQKLITDKQEWEAFIATRPEANFLQSWNWGQFHTSLGKKVFYFGWFIEGVQVGAALVVKEPAKRGAYLSIAGGPLCDWYKREALTQMMRDIKQVAKQEKAVFIRFRPQLEDSSEARELIAMVGAQLAPMHVTADITVQLDLRKTPDELLAGMRKSTRYEIRHAEKLGITTRISTEPADIERMYQDQLQLAKHHGFVPFSLAFWQKQFSAFRTDDQVVLVHAYLQDELLATAFIIFYNGEAVYHYGTSTAANGKLPGSYACQWAAILEAQRRGCVRYNFWGIAPPNQPHHRFAGVTLFKTGFSDKVISYVPACDIAVNWQYGLTKSFELIRKKLRRL